MMNPVGHFINFIVIYSLITLIFLSILIFIHGFKDFDDENSKWLFVSSILWPISFALYLPAWLFHWVEFILKLRKYLKIGD